MTVLGCIADDLTGATDLADTLVRAGVPTELLVGADHHVVGATEGEGDRSSARPRAVVIALRIRTVGAREAVVQACRALDVLRAREATPTRLSVYLKVCSTFDSTDEGNIGPVADALAERLGSRATLVCPAFPTNGRTVYGGHLFVGDDLLSESPMRHHPLTPMTDSNLVRVLARQSRHPVGRVPLTVVLGGPRAVAELLPADTGPGAAATPRGAIDPIHHLVADAVTDADLDVLGEAAVAAQLALCVGGSGLAGGLARALAGTAPVGIGAAGIGTAGIGTVGIGAGRTAAQAAGGRGPEGRQDIPSSATTVKAVGPVVVLAGSCSEATRGQVARFDGIRLVIEPRRLPTQVDDLAPQLVAGLERGMSVLVGSTAGPDEVAAVQRDLGREEASRRIDEAFGQLARTAVGAGARRIIVAGGETAGAVVDALGLRSLGIGPTIAPGVPWTTGRLVDGREVALALKSGNFGGEDFFARAVAVLDG